MSQGVKHVVVGDTVLAGAGFDVHWSQRIWSTWRPSICVDGFERARWLEG